MMRAVRADAGVMNKCVLLSSLALIIACGGNAPVPPDRTDAGTSADAGTQSARYSGYRIISALDRIGISRESDSPLSCTRFVLVSPAQFPNGDGGFTAPAPWHLGGVTTTDHDCADGGYGPNLASTFNAFGTVSFHGDGGYGYPETIDLHATVFFEQNDGGFPPTSGVQFDVDALPVQ